MFRKIRRQTSEHILQTKVIYHLSGSKYTKKMSVKSGYNYINATELLPE
jgi:hypothetical protein